ncbi:MAG: TonB-dependent receptor, partial [Terriglobia bacterium]
QGAVTDSSSAGIPGATVALLNVNTGLRAVATTNESGVYRFDYVDPGKYTLTVEQSGFARFSQENFSVQAGGDITVNVPLQIGGVREAVTVAASPVEVQFNNTNVTMTIDTKMAQDLPRFERNPFKLSLLDPTVVETRRGEMNPYNSYSPNSVEMGGLTNLKNELQVDGSPVGIAYKAAWVPNTDSVQETIVQKNAVDASVGHSAGGTLSIATRSGTNEWHGVASWLGRIPAMNAVTDRTTNTFTAARNNIYGGTLGNPIIRNKLFSFFSYEAQRLRTPATTLWTVPTPAEIGGDFSQSLNTNGALRTIYDPFTTTFDPATGAVTRQAFSGNRIPASRFDSLGARWAGDLAAFVPNRPPDNITGQNNYSFINVGLTNYWNLSERVDYYLNPSIRIFARPSLYRTAVLTVPPDLLLKNELYTQSGSTRNGFTLPAQVLWTVNPTTVISFSGDRRDFVDQFNSPNADVDNYAKFWPGNNWYAPFAMKAGVYPNYMPGVVLTNGSTNALTLGSPGNHWQQQPNGQSYAVNVSQQRGRHFLRTGFEARHEGGKLLAVQGNQFAFNSTMTANTFINPNTKLVGDQFATLLLGAIDDQSQAVAAPVNQNRITYYGAYFQDDYKLNANITLNLGLRWEYETPWHDDLHQQSIGPDLTVPTPGVSANPPNVPSSVTSLLTVPYSFTGSWVGTSDSNPGVWQSQKLVFMPRIGIAWRVNDKTAVRFGYARYVTPSELNYVGRSYGSFEALNFMQPPYPGYDASQSPLPLNNGVPQQFVSNPYTKNPIVAPSGATAGPAIGLGAANIAWAGADFIRPVNDRFNLTVSRQLPGRIVVNATFFMNQGHDLTYSRNLNLVDPRVVYKYGSATSATVANPFYNYLTPAQFPGPLRNQLTVPLTSLLVQRPQYGNLWETFASGVSEQYYSGDIRVQRAFANGFNFLFGYSYIREKCQCITASTSAQAIAPYYANAIDAYNNHLDWVDSINPHHRFTAAGTYQLPFGRGRTFLGNT